MLLTTNHTEKLFLVSVCALAGGLWLPIVFSNILIGVAAFFWMINVLANKSFSVTIKHKVVVSLYVLFVTYVFSAILSTNYMEGWHIVERRLPLVALPLLFFNSVVQQHLSYIIKYFVGGVFIALMYCVSIAAYHALANNQTHYLFYHQLTAPIKINAVHFSTYVVAAIFWLLNSTFKKQYLKIMLLAILCVGCLLLSSKTMLLVLCVGLIILGVKKVKTYLIFSFVLTFVLAVLIIPPIKQRFALEYNANLSVVGQQFYQYNTPFTGLTLRLVIWKHCLNIINEQRAWLTGVGTGDFQDELNSKYKATQMYTGNPALKDTGYIGYGPHNQYMEIIFSMGVIGLLIFMTHLYLLLAAIYRTNMVNVLLYLLMVVAMFSECVISTNKGVLLYAFVASCIVVSSNSIKNAY